MKLSTLLLVCSADTPCGTGDSFCNVCICAYIFQEFPLQVYWAFALYITAIYECRFNVSCVPHLLPAVQSGIQCVDGILTYPEEHRIHEHISIQNSVLRAAGRCSLALKQGAVVH